eukprot:2293465-Rhodomonas_salina.4
MSGARDSDTGGGRVRGRREFGWLSDVCRGSARAIQTLVTEGLRSSAAYVRHASKILKTVNLMA